MAKRHITSVQIILEYATSKKIDTQVLLLNSDIQLEQLTAAGVEIEDRQELQVLDNLLQKLGNSFLTGMELGRLYHLTSYGIFGYALLASNSLRKALSFGQKYLALTFIFSDLALNESEDNASIEFVGKGELDNKELETLVTIRDMWAVLLIMKELYPEHHPTFTIELCIAQPSYLTKQGLIDLQQQLGAEIKFSSSRNAFSDLSELLDQPLPKANELTAKICEQQCNELLRQKQHWKHTAQQVRSILLTLGLNASMEDVASSLARTTRTLHRQLKSEGSSWRQVRDDVRLGLAEEYLKQLFPMDEIAERLGYSDAANFSHAFKRWKGITPSAFRKIRS